ncbi:PDZ domain-containing protein [Candidatus Dojkabacteria bacterium]|nr:PDZ domain-containing protein [Candidatus Dojkabacteria bacterium]
MNKNFKKVSIGFGFVVLAGMVFVAGFVTGKINTEKTVSPSYELTGDLKGEYKSVNVDTLWEVWSELESSYIEENLDGQAMIDGAIKGLVNSLGNEYNSYLTAEETIDYLESNAGEFEGIGTTLRYTGEYTEIETPIDGYPAQEAGLRPGDKIIEVNGTNMKGKEAFEAAELIKGEAGTTVALKIVRLGEENPLDFEIKREEIDIDSISFGEIEEGLYKIKITQFTEDSLFEFKDQWDEAARDIYENNPDTIIMDLRNNPGGYVDGVLYVLDEFFPRNTLLMSERDREGNTRDLKAKRNGRFEDTDLIVLINEGSASASEIFAGAVQDNDRGEIIGMPTVGKGVEQRVITLKNGGSLHVVFQEWVLPSGRVIDRESPIEPDMEVELDEDDFLNRRDPQLDRAIEYINK